MTDTPTVTVVLEVDAGMVAAVADALTVEVAAHQRAATRAAREAGPDPSPTSAAAIAGTLSTAGDLEEFVTRLRSALTRAEAAAGVPGRAHPPAETADAATVTDLTRRAIAQHDGQPGQPAAAPVTPTQFAQDPHAALRAELDRINGPDDHATPGAAIHALPGSDELADAIASIALTADIPDDATVAPVTGGLLATLGPGVA